MRIKFLSVIVSFLLVSIAVSSCLDDNTTNEYSSDATVRAFSLEAINGKSYTFSIDQINHRIFNRDSMPVASDTILDSIKIATFTVNWVITSGATDTVLNINNYQDLRAAINNPDGMEFKVHAPDGVNQSIYHLTINVHLQDPDSLTWNEMGEPFSTTPVEGRQRAIVLSSDLIVYTSPTEAYLTSTLPGLYHWSRLSPTGLPTNADPTSVIRFQEHLYMASASGALYRSADGSEWQETTAPEGRITSLVATLPDRLIAIRELEGEKRFCITTDGLTWQEGDIVPENFPTESIYASSFQTANGVDEAIATGMPQDGKQTVPWMTTDGLNWADMFTPTDAYCPALSNPIVMHYGDNFYLFGGTLQTIYTSPTGIAWSAVEEKFMLPDAFKGREAYSMAIDGDNYLWMIFGGEGTPNAVWRGRLNRLGFLRQ